MPLQGSIQMDGKKDSIDSDNIALSLRATPSAKIHAAAGSSEPTTVTSTLSIKGGVLVTVTTVRDGGGQTTTTTTTDTNTNTTTSTTTTTDSSGNTHGTTEIRQK
jgi:hypothetical protein